MSEYLRACEALGKVPNNAERQLAQAERNARQLAELGVKAQVHEWACRNFYGISATAMRDLVETLGLQKVVKP